MLVHEMVEGQVSQIGGLWYVRPPGKGKAALAPSLPIVHHECDRLTFLHPFRIPGGDVAYFVHGEWRRIDGSVIDNVGAQ